MTHRENMVRRAAAACCGLVATGMTLAGAFAALPHYRRHMQGKFKTVAALNRELGSAYQSFAEIRLPSRRQTRR